MVIAFVHWHIAAPFFRLGVQIFERVEEFLAAKSSDSVQTIGICDNTYVGPSYTHLWSQDEIVAL